MDAKADEKWRVAEDFAGYTRVEYNGWKLLIDGSRDESADFCRMANSRLSALQQQLADAEAALVLAVKHGRSGIYPVNPYIRKALQVVDPEHFPSPITPEEAQG